MLLTLLMGHRATVESKGITPGIFMRKLITLPVLLLPFGLVCARDHPIDRREADAIAKDWYLDFAKHEPARAQMLGPPAVEVRADGWSYRWKCKTSVQRGLGVFVERSGRADYSESPYCDGTFP